jgi:hypothetical protein
MQAKLQQKHRLLEIRNQAHTRHLQACLQLCALALSTTGLVQLKIEADSLEDRLTTMQPEMEAIGRKLSEEATQWQEVPAASTAPPR